MTDFVTRQADLDRGHTMAEVGSATGVGPEDVVALMQCLNGLTECGVLQSGPSAGSSGPLAARAR